MGRRNPAHENKINHVVVRNPEANRIIRERSIGDEPYSQTAARLIIAHDAMLSGMDAGQRQTTLDILKRVSSAPSP